MEHGQGIMVVASCHRSSLFVIEDAEAQESFGKQWLNMVYYSGVYIQDLGASCIVVVRNEYVY